MTFEFESLVGHLYMVGGRPISMPPPGARVEVAPLKAARGRETETFFTLVLPSGEVPAPSRFYEQMASLAVEHYFENTGSVTAALRSVFNTINQNLVEHNRSGRSTYEANMLCAVMRGSDLIVARVGAGVILMREPGITRTFPENLADDDALFAPPLGVHPIPDLKMSRYTIGDGSRLVLGDVNLAEIPIEKITSALVARDISAVLMAFRELVSRQVTLMTVEFVPPDVPAPIPVREGESTAELITRTSEVPKVNPAESASPSSQRRKRPGGVLQTQAKRGAGSVALGLSRFLAFLNNLLDRFFAPPKEGERKWMSTPLASGIVVLIPVAVVVVVIATWLGAAPESEFETCIGEATSRAELARSIAPTNRTDTLNAWNLVLAQVAACKEIRPNDALLTALKSEGQAIIDKLNLIQRREARVVASLPNASLRRIILQGSDLYVLDEANALVYRIALSADGLSAASAPQPIPAMRRGAVVDQFTIGSLIDITFGQQENMVVAVDSEGVVVKCSPRFITNCEPQRLLAAENWVNPVAVKVWQSRLYILDTGANQIWRYDPSGDLYAGAPREYFTGQGRPPLVSAVDFGIDDTGRVYILRADGILTKYFQGESEDFGWAAFPPGEPASANALHLSQSPIFPGLFVATRANRTIYEATLAGSFSASYRVFDEDQLTLLADVAADASQQLIYAASGNSVLVFSK